MPIRFPLFLACQLLHSPKMDKTQWKLWDFETILLYNYESNLPLFEILKVAQRISHNKRESESPSNWITTQKIFSRKPSPGSRFLARVLICFWELKTIKTHFRIPDMQVEQFLDTSLHIEPITWIPQKKSMNVYCTVGLSAESDCPITETIRITILFKATTFTIRFLANILKALSNSPKETKKKKESCNERNR